VTEDRSVLSRPAEPADDVLAYGEERDQVVEFWYGDPRRPVVVLVHGGFWRPDWDRAHLRPMAAALRSAGWPVALPEYRRVPGDPDRAVSDVRAAVDALPALLGPSRYDSSVLLAGHSAGGHLALLTSDRPGVRGVLALAPVADLQLAERLDLDEGAVRDFLGTAAADRPDLDPLIRPAPAVPVAVHHGDADPYVPLDLSRSYTTRHPTVRLLELPGADHFALIDPFSQTWPTLLTELAAL
jgi:acetyl esterase/lipase